MTHVIQIIGTATRLFEREDRPVYIASYDPDGELLVTIDLDEAKRYLDGRAASEDWRAISVEHPVRMDGLPNRPLSAYTIVITTLEQAREEVERWAAT